MPKLRVVATGLLIDVPANPVYDPGERLWRCGTARFLDVDGRTYEPVPDPPARLQVSRPEFKQLLTSSERIAIRTARAYSGTDAQAVAIKAGLDDLFDILDDPALTYVDLTLPTTAAGVQLLAQAGLIAPERVAEILQGWRD